MKQSLLIFCALLTVNLIAAGCGGGASEGPAVYPVSGTVTLNGEPVQEGAMVFMDPDGQSKSFGARIENGEFSTEMTPGKKKVEITATRESKTKMSPGPSGGPPVPAIEQYIPAEYNEKTTLEADVSADGGNEIKFELKSS